MTDYDTQITHYDCPIVAHFDDGTYVSVCGFDYRNDVASEIDPKFHAVTIDEHWYVRLKSGDPWIPLRDARTAEFAYRKFYNPEAAFPQTRLMVVNAIGNAPGGWYRL